MRLGPNISDNEKQANRKAAWQVRPVPNDKKGATEAAWELYDPDRLENENLIAGPFATLSDAGRAVSDLKTYGHIQPREDATAEAAGVTAEGAVPPHAVAGPHINPEIVHQQTDQELVATDVRTDIHTE